MKCRSCEFDLEGEWDFCPRCGARKGGDHMDTFGRDLFSEMFNRIRSSFQNDEMDKLFEKDIEALDLSPWFKKMEDEKSFKPVHGRGFSIHISSGTGRPPKVSVKTFGDVGNEKIGKVVKDDLGILQKAGIEDVNETGEHKPASFLRKPMPKITEEPKTEVKRVGGSVVVDINIPGVKSDDDIEIKRLESSVEVKAIAGEKAYFKILTKPAQFRLVGRSFNNGVLSLEFS